MPPAPTIQTLQAIQLDTRGPLNGAVKEVWPDQFSPLKNFDLSFSPDGISVHMQYESADPLPAEAVQIMTRSLESRLGFAPIRLVPENLPPPKPARTAKTRKNR